MKRKPIQSTRPRISRARISRPVKKNKLTELLAVDKNYASNCVNKWQEVLNTEFANPIANSTVNTNTAIMLENQQRSLYEDATNTSTIWGVNAAYGGAISAGDNYAKGDQRMPKVLIPMIRRAFPELISNEVVGVQPMTAPVSLAFAMRFRYAEGPLHTDSAACSGRYPGYPSTDPAALAALGIEPTGYPMPQDGVYQGHYGVGTYRPPVTATGEAWPNPAGSTDMRQLAATVGQEMGYNYMDNAYTGRRNHLFNRSKNPATGAPWTDAEIIVKWNGIGRTQVQSVAQIEQLAAMSATPDEKTAANALLNMTALAAGKLILSDQDIGVAALTGDYEATGHIPKTKFAIEKKSVEAGTRRIGTSWTLELEQDLRNMSGIDIDTEVTSMMSYELQAEIDREMIIRMFYSAVSANEYSFWDATKSDARWMGERNRVFYQFIMQQSNRMAVRNRRGPANFLIATPDVCTLLETLQEFTIMEVNTSLNTNQVGISKIGSVGNGRFTVFRDTRTPVQNNSWINNQWDNQGQYTVGGVKRTVGIPDYCLLGYKGSEVYDAGIIFCPYIPIMLQRTVDPSSYEPNVGLLTRYGVVDNLFGAELYYHVILIDTLGNVIPPASDPANTYPANSASTYATTAPFGSVSPFDGSDISGTAIHAQSAQGAEAVQGGYPVMVANTDANPVPTQEV